VLIKNWFLQRVENEYCIPLFNAIIQVLSAGNNELAQMIFNENLSPLLMKNTREEAYPNTITTTTTTTNQRNSSEDYDEFLEKYEEVDSSEENLIALKK